MSIQKYTAYYRVSTERQGKSGLGLESQRQIVTSFIGTRGIVDGEFVEIESGKKNNRVQLLKAIAHAKTIGATLVIAKLDRLSRNVGFIFKLRDSGVDFVCCDMPDANTLTIGIFATMAQHERELISGRVKAALNIKKSQGFTLGKPENLTNEHRKKGVEVRKELARINTANIQARELARMYREKNLTLKKIAENLNAKGFRTRNDCDFKPMSVSRLLKSEEIFTYI